MHPGSQCPRCIATDIGDFGRGWSIGNWAAGEAFATRAAVFALVGAVAALVGPRQYLLKLEKSTAPAADGVAVAHAAAKGSACGAICNADTWGKDSCIY